MKVKELIEKLKQLPQENDVVVFDWKQNIHYASDDPTSEGIHSDFKVESTSFVKVDDEDEDGYTSEDVVVLTIENMDYNDDGTKIEY